jgi:hypothetical protein
MQKHELHLWMENANANITKWTENLAEQLNMAVQNALGVALTRMNTAINSNSRSTRTISPTETTMDENASKGK